MTFNEKHLLVTLAWMYIQYCNGPTGHNFMNAGEDAQEVLENHGLLKDGYVDEVKLTELERSLWAVKT